MSSGNPRITVAFPFSTIRISQPNPQLQALTGLVLKLAGHAAVLARELDTDEAEALDALVGEVQALALALDND
ncbi:MAG TPA: hypothetical protein VFP72_17195 [Kineosporiaceae bacterium]|nr:hypothetical protein [Kineosporiaceae bacterium]